MSIDFSEVHSYISWISATGLCAFSHKLYSPDIVNRNPGTITEMQGRPSDLAFIKSLEAKINAQKTSMSYTVSGTAYQTTSTLEHIKIYLKGGVYTINAQFRHEFNFGISPHVEEVDITLSPSDENGFIAWAKTMDQFAHSAMGVSFPDGN